MGSAYDWSDYEDDLAKEADHGADPVNDDLLVPQSGFAAVVRENTELQEGVAGSDPTTRSRRGRHPTIIEGWYRLPGAEGTWWREPLDGRGSPQHEPVTDAERVWLASVSPPADTEDP